MTHSDEHMWSLFSLCTGLSLEERCSTSDGGKESMEALEVGPPTLVERQQKSRSTPDEACSTSDSDQSSLAEQFLHVKVTAPQRAAAVRHAALKQLTPMQVSTSIANKEMHELFPTLSHTQETSTKPMARTQERVWDIVMQKQQQAKGQLIASSSVLQPQELASMQDIVDGLQLSQHFDMTSQMLMRQITTMRDSLAVFNAGASQKCACAARLLNSLLVCQSNSAHPLLAAGSVYDIPASRPDGEQAFVGKAVESEPLQDLPAFLNGESDSQFGNLISMGCLPEAKRLK